MTALILKEISWKLVLPPTFHSTTKFYYFQYFSFFLRVITIILAFLLPAARIVPQNYYYFANKSHFRIPFFFVWLHSNEIVSAKNEFSYQI